MQSRPAGHLRTLLHSQFDGMGDIAPMASRTPSIVRSGPQKLATPDISSFVPGLGGLRYGVPILEKCDA
jgi:hypothetical protein